MEQQEKSRHFSLAQVVGLVLGAMVLTALATGFALRSWLFAKPFEPVTLAPAEQTRLEQKLERLDFAAPATQEPAGESGRVEPDGPQEPPLEPEAYSEEGASRTIHLTERELNYLLAKNTDLARTMAIDLAQDLVSLRLLIPVDPDFPVLGGKTVKVRAGAELAYRQKRPVVILKGVSVMGVPIPNAWLGNLKNIDLVQQFGSEEGFWKTFSEGVDSIDIREGTLDITLKE